MYTSRLRKRWRSVLVPNAVVEEEQVEKVDGSSLFVSPEEEEEGAPFLFSPTSGEAGATLPN
jgi:hypothetical protein